MFIFKKSVLNILLNIIPHDTIIVDGKDPKILYNSEKKTRFIKDIDSVKTIITKFLRKLKFLQVHLYNETEVSKLNSSSRITCIVKALIRWHHRYKSTCSEIELIDISLKAEVLSTAYTRSNNKKIAYARASILSSVNSH